jgi:glycosyltransferase involved in cell wall biosynthesis
VRLSVVIATKDRAAYVARALASLEAQSGAPGFEVVVVDNGSSDGTKTVVAKHQAMRGGYPLVYVYEPEPNRGKARNRGIEVARGELIAFCDDDVQAPPGWLAAHDAAHRDGATPRVVNGPILNVASYDDRPKPSMVNYSRAYLCTCNASVPRAALLLAGGFDEAFHLYGWEDTELGVRLREAGVGWKFAWDAAIWHIKPPGENTLEVETRKALERAKMARRFIEKHPSKRARMATGAHGINAVRGRYLLPDALLALYAGVATGKRGPAWARALARAQFLDGIYTRELIRVLDGNGGE